MNNGSLSFLFLLNNLERGGVQTQLLYLCRSLIQDGHRCSVTSFRSEPDTMAVDFFNAGVETLSLGRKKTLETGSLLALRKLIAKGNFDIVHALTPQAGFQAALFLPLFRRPGFVTSILNTYSYKNIALRILENLVTARRADAVFTNSIAAARYYRSSVCSPPWIWIIPNGVLPVGEKCKADVRSDLGISPDEISLVCVGRLSPVKRHGDAIKALRLLDTKHHNVKLYIIGDGDERKDLEGLADRLDLAERVIFTGDRSDVREILPAFDIFILPSESESFPNALLEAMSSGLPCIATKVGGIPEIIRHGVTGITVPPQRPDLMASEISNLVKSPKKRDSLGRNAKADVLKRFGMDTLIQRMKEYYGKLAEPVQYDVAYIFSAFPKISEAFILRELVELRKRGLKCCVLSLKSPSEGVIHEDALDIMPDVFYLPFISPGILSGNVAEMFQDPCRYFRAFVSFMRLHRRRPREMVKAFLCWWKTVTFARILRKHHVKHVHANWANIPAACGLAMARFSDSTFSFTAHAFDIYGLPTSLDDKIRSSSFVTTCTARNKTHLQSLVEKEYRPRIHLVRHSLSEPEVSDTVKASNRKRPVIISVGSLERYKGHHVLLDAAAILASKGMDFDIRIIGDGPERLSLLRLAEDLGIAERLALPGWIPQEQVFSEMARADVFALASIPLKHQDNLPNVLVEASLLNLPCIVSLVGSINEFIINGETGLLVHPENPLELAQGIANLLESPSLGKTLAHNARKKAERLFDPSRNGDILEYLFREILKSGRK